MNFHKRQVLCFGDRAGHARAGAHVPLRAARRAAHRAAGRAGPMPVPAPAGGQRPERRRRSWVPARGRTRPTGKSPSLSGVTGPPTSRRAGGALRPGGLWADEGLVRGARAGAGRSRASIMMAARARIRVGGDRPAPPSVWPFSWNHQCIFRLAAGRISQGAAP